MVHPSSAETAGCVSQILNFMHPNEPFNARAKRAPWTQWGGDLEPEAVKQMVKWSNFVEFGVFTADPSQAALLGMDPGESVALLSHSGSRGTGARVCEV